MKRQVSHILALFLILFMGQNVLLAQDSLLNEYIRVGLESNLALKQKELDYSRSLYALREAKGLFFPDVSINARYTLADGGRVIEFPVGDLLNPVYSTLNLLTGSANFPSIENQEFSFYRPREQETKATLVQPVFSADLVHNYQIKKDLVRIGEADVALYRRELVMTITTAYYELKKVLLLQDLAREAGLLLEENVRVSRKLFENDKVTIDVLYRSEAEYAKVKAQKEELSGLEVSARAYFNFLLNRELDEDVVFGKNPDMLMPLANLTAAQDDAIGSREELDLLAYYKQLNMHRLKLVRGANLPGIYGVVNYGFQGEKYSFTPDDDFVLASIVFQWNLFSGFSKQYKVKQIRIEQEQVDLRIAESKNLIKLQVLNAWSAMNTAWNKVESGKEQLRSAKKAFEMINRKYTEGEISLLEYIDARTNMTNSETDIIISTTEFYIQKAAYDRAVATGEY